MVTFEGRDALIGRKVCFNSLLPPTLELLCIKQWYVKGADSNMDCIALNDWTTANWK